MSPVSPKVFSMFLETLVDFVLVHREDLQDWLFVLLTQLLKKMGADLLGSVQAKVQKALDVTRSELKPHLYYRFHTGHFFLHPLFAFQHDSTHYGGCVTRPARYSLVWLCLVV